MVTFSSLASATIQGAKIIPDKKIAPLISVFQPTDPFTRDILGFGDLIRDITNIKMNDPARYNSAKGSTGIDYFKKLNVQVPQRAVFIDEESALVIRHNNIPMTYSCRAGSDYTVAASGTFDMASPAALLPVNGVFRITQADSTVATFIVTSNSPASDGGATIGYKLIAGTANTIDNTPTGATVYYMATYFAEGSRITKQKYRLPTTENFGLSIIETPVEVTTQSEVTRLQTEDEEVIAAVNLLSQDEFVGRQITQAFMMAPGVTSVTDAAGNTFPIQSGIMEMSGIGSTAAPSGGIGPTVIETAIDNIAKKESKAAPFERRGEMAVFDAYAGLATMRLVNRMLRTSAAPFGQNVQVQHGQTTFNINLKEWIGIAGILRFHYDRTFDDSVYANRMLIVNKNSIIPMFKTDHFMRLAPSPADTTHNTKTWVCTNQLGLSVLVKDHVQLITGITGIET